MSLKHLALAAAAALALASGAHAADDWHEVAPTPAGASDGARTVMQWWFHEHRLCARGLRSECDVADELEAALNRRGWERVSGTSVIWRSLRSDTIGH